MGDYALVSTTVSILSPSPCVESPIYAQVLKMERGWGEVKRERLNTLSLAKRWGI
jgi:hypothetical protein